MPGTLGQIERKTQQRVVKLFREVLGYDYFGNWTDREGNANIEPDLPRAAGARRRGPDQGRLRAGHRPRLEWAAALRQLIACRG
jgi:type I restriction enzyme, R subunit